MTTTINLICALVLASLLVYQLLPQETKNYLFHPGYSCCYRCHKTWDIVEYHETQYTDNAACFPLCEKCWGELETPQARLPYYRQLITKWMEHSDTAWEKWPAIEKAVMEGK